MVKSWLVQDQTVLGKDYSNLLIADSLLKTIWFINAPCYGNEALASPKANELTIPEQTATGKGKSNPFMAAKDVDEDGKCLKIRSRCVKVFGYILQELKKINLKKHEVKQVQQSCLGEDCWELYIPDLVLLGCKDLFSLGLTHDAHTIVEARCLELEAELSNLRDKIQNDNHNELVKRLSILRKMKVSLQGKDNVINKLKTQISHLQETRSEADRTLDFRALDFQIT
ncbi:hypothetical protein Tco_0426357 [Tanacetum coccineum]